VFGVQAESTLVSFEANELKSVEMEETDGLALRAVIGGDWALRSDGPTRVTRTDRQPDGFCPSGRQNTIIFPGALRPPPLRTCDPSLAQVQASQLIAIGREIVHALTDIDRNASVHVDVQKSIERVTLRNTAGAEIDEDFGSLIVGVAVERVRGRDVLILGDESESLSLDDTYHQVVERLGRHLRMARRSARIRSGHMPVLFSPAGAAVLTLPSF